MTSEAPRSHEAGREGPDGTNGPGRPEGGFSARRVPHNLEAEQSLLGSMLLRREAVAAAVEARLVGASFYKPSHRHVFEAIVDLWTRGEGIDPVTVSDALARSGHLDVVGGTRALVALQADTPAIDNAPKYAQIVFDHAVLRRLVAAGSEVMSLGFSVPEDVDEAVTAAVEAVLAVAGADRAFGAIPLRQGIEEALDVLEAFSETATDVPGIPTGFLDFDDCIGGLKPGELIVVGGRPGMGKTSFALGAATHAARESATPVLMFSLEMSRLELVQRVLSGEARIEGQKLRRADLTDDDWQRLAAAVGRLADAPLHIADVGSVNMTEITAQAKRFVAGRGVLVVDYLQLMRTKRAGQNRQEFVSEVARGFKLLARDLKIPVVLLSQLSRAVDSRSDKRPILSDLRESGEIEQAADVVAFLYRDEVYDPASADRGMAEVIVAKNRNGPTGTTRLAFLERYARFVNMARDNV